MQRLFIFEIQNNRDLYFEKLMYNFKYLKIMNLQNLGVQEMNAKELTTVDGGNQLTGYYYGQGYNADAYEGIAHELGDFFRGVYDGLSSLWN